MICLLFSASRCGRDYRSRMTANCAKRTARCVDVERSLAREPARLRRPNFVLATPTPLAHIAIMVEIHPYSFNVVTDPLRDSRYRWTVCEGNQIHMRSPCSYATRSEAEKEAARAVSRRVEHWRNGG